jgi:hypothetical protein
MGTNFCHRQRCLTDGKIALNMFLDITHTEKVRKTTRGCRLWDVKNIGCKNLSPTEVKHTFINQNLSIFITKVCEISIKPKALHKTSAPTYQLWNFFILNLCSFHFHYVAIILHLWLMKFSMPDSLHDTNTFRSIHDIFEVRRKQKSLGEF